jgi:hypothetical protein
MHTISLLKDNKFSEETYVDYSKFKHGSKNVARKFGKGLAKKIIEENFLEGIKNLIIYPAPYKNIPTASSALKDYLLASLSMDFLNKGISVKEGKIYRQYSYDDDYGQMNREERDKAISSDIFSIDKNFIDPTDTLVFIDDIKITGSHEQRIKELLEREEITNPVMFIYLYEYTGEDAVTEHRLNHHSVNNLKDVNDIIRNDKFIFNTRVIKYILKADISEFVNFIDYQSDIFQETLFRYSVLNDYHQNEKYRMNFDILHNIVKKL